MYDFVGYYFQIFILFFLKKIYRFCNKIKFIKKEEFNVDINDDSFEVINGNNK